jgi:hypothetical protein
VKLDRIWLGKETRGDDAKLEKTPARELYYYY